MVSELSRLSRSIKDFSQIWEMMYLRKELGAKTPGSLGFGQAEPTQVFLKPGGWRRLTNGGLDGDRTHDLRIANAALSQTELRAPTRELKNICHALPGSASRGPASAEF